MKLFIGLVAWMGAVTLLWAQGPPASPVAATPTNAVVEARSAGTNQADSATLQELAEKIQKLESRTSQRDNAESEQLKGQLFEAKSKLESLRESEADNPIYRVLYVVVALAAVSIFGLVAFCFYTLRRLTQLGEPIFDNLHTRHPMLAYGAPAGALPYATGSVEPGAVTAVGPLGEDRLLNAVDRLERKIQEIEGLAHHENNHVPPPPVENSPPDLARNHHHADRFVLLLNKGEAHTNLQQYDRAIACFEEAIALAPLDPTPLVKKGYALEKLGRLDEAVLCYDQAVQIDPGYSMAYLFKGGVCNRLQKYAEAIDCYDRALAVRGDERSGK